ncbi:MAG: acyl carrier protein [Patescibacteria group bacterium]|jgi:acyl carrier protein
MNKPKISEEEQKAINGIFDKLKKSILVYMETNELFTSGAEPKIELSSHLEDDLGLDSFSRFEVVLLIEHEFGSEIGTDMNDFETIEDIARQLVAKKN